MNKQEIQRGIEEKDELASEICKSICIKNNCINGCPHIDKPCNHARYVAEELIKLGYHKQVWHKVADGDFPIKVGQYLCKCQTGCYACFNYSLIDNAFLEQDTATKEFYITNNVIAWTELPEYKE